MNELKTTILTYLINQIDQTEKERDFYGIGSVIWNEENIKLQTYIKTFADLCVIFENYENEFDEIIKRLDGHLTDINNILDRTKESKSPFEKSEWQGHSDTSFNNR